MSHNETFLATASEVISPEIHVPISRVEVPQALCQIEGFPATRPKIGKHMYIYSERPKMDWKLPGYAKDMEQLIDVIHTTYCIYAKVEEGGRVRWFLYILLFALKAK